MKMNDNLNKLTDDAMNSMDDAGKATPPPYLLTRINARLKETPANFWERASLLMGKPVVAASFVLVLIMTNVFVIIQNKQQTFNNVADQPIQSPADDFSTVATIYDNENP